MLKLLRPDIMIEAIWELDAQSLRERGIAGVIMDLDNTIVDWNRSELRDEVRQWMERARAAGLRLCIASNSRSKRRVSAVAEQIGAQWLAPAAKPSRRGLRRAMNLIACQPDTTCLIGDQLFTDIMGGNRAGMLTVLVRPLSSRDFPATKIMRLLERLLLPILRREHHP